jgi:hypothetical protein
VFSWLGGKNMFLQSMLKKALWGFVSAFGGTTVMMLQFGVENFTPTTQPEQMMWPIVSGIIAGVINAIQKAIRWKK